MQQRFSIVIPVYNRAPVLPRVLDSVAAQTWRPLHLVLVDNASTDASARVMREWAAAHACADLEISLLTEYAHGAAAARNRGLREVRSSYMLFFDSDDALAPEAVSRYMAVFQSDSSVDIVCADCMYHPIGRLPRLVRARGGALLDTHIHHCLLRTQAYAVRTELLREAGGWNEQARIWDDWELGVRLLLRNPTVRLEHFVAADIYESEESLTGRSYSEKALYYETPIKAVEQAAQTSGHPAARRVMALMCYRRMMLAALFAREGREDLALPLRDEVLGNVSRRMGLLLRAAYIYIRCGGRGFDRILSLLL